MKEYTTPEVEVIKFQSETAIASGEDNTFLSVVGGVGPSNPFLPGN